MVHFGRRWVFKKMARCSGLLRDHWAPARQGVNRVAVVPPGPGYRYWGVVVDGFELLELRGPEAMSIALTVGTAFIRQRTRFRVVLEGHRYCRRPKERRPHS